jgi:hypothetical protein
MGCESRTCRPSRLSSPNFNLSRPSRNILDVLERLHNVIEISVSGIRDGAPLPESKGVGQEKVGPALDDGVGGPVGVFIPAVSGSNAKEAIGGGPDGLHLGPQGWAGEVASVQGFGADSDCVHDVGVCRGILLNGSQVELVGLIGVRPWVWSQMMHSWAIETYQIPRMTWKPWALAAGRMF